MTDRTTGLRFDIYERVQLSEEIEDIQQLDEIELIPQIELITLDEQAQLKGNLVLRGHYLSGQEVGNIRSLEHLIPVEITLPLNRVHNLSDIGVEIENFDVDLLSPRSLNVTGVLSLRGVELNNLNQEEQWRDEDEVVFIHQASEESNSFISEADMEWEQRENSESFDRHEADIEQVQESSLASHPEFKEEELKISFNNQPMDFEANEAKSQQFQTLLHNDQFASIDQGISRESDHNISVHSEKETGTSVMEPVVEAEWKSLFLNREGEEPKFSKMKMCIVQKQETIETIADRYKLNSREILLYNRLNDQNLTEGQIIYIPV